MNIQTSDKNHFTEGIIYASETTKIVDENHALQQAFLNELDEKLKGVLQRISGYAVNENTQRGLIILFSYANFTRPNYNTYGVQRDVNISLVCTGNPVGLLGKWVLIHLGFAMSVIDEDEAKKTQEALLAMSQLEHEVGDFLGLNQK
ncbi:HypC/HybG/HupF family hydrogenase formation chaperone [Haemophilus haemolyticus]|nr:HypC/HybG/HupF family hydrogenase formation chaperone [Haemophilus haemolyticus]